MNTGLRRGEALALQWSDIDFDEKLLRVRGTLARVAGELVVTETKTPKSRRVIPLSPAAERLLRDVRALLGEDGPQMIQLVDDHATGDRMVTRAGLREISTYAQGIGPSRDRILGTDGRRPSSLVEEAHRAALSVFCWTLRAENAFLPEHLRVGDAPEGLGDALAEARQLLALGVDGLITDSPDHAVQAVAELCDLRSSGAHRGHVPLALS